MALKVAEQRLCCVLRLDGLEASVEAFAAFVDRCEQTERESEDPQIPYTNPLNLVHVLEHIDTTAVSEEAARCLCALARRLDVAARGKGWVAGLLCDDEE